MLVAAALPVISKKKLAELTSAERLYNRPLVLDTAVRVSRYYRNLCGIQRLLSLQNAPSSNSRHSSHDNSDVCSLCVTYMYDGMVVMVVEHFPK